MGCTSASARRWRKASAVGGRRVYWTWRRSIVCARPPVSNRRDTARRAPTQWLAHRLPKDGFQLLGRSAAWIAQVDLVMPAPRAVTLLLDEFMQSLDRG